MFVGRKLSGIKFHARIIASFYFEVYFILASLVSNAANIRYEVINAGVDGFNAVDELHVLKYLLPKYHPDLIIWFLVNNDWDDSLSINNRGQLVSMYKKYAASICWLDLTWGWNTPLCYPDNFYLSMNERSRYWAEGKSWSLLKKLDNKMKNHFNFYDIIRDRIVSSVRNSVPQDTNERAFPKSIFKASITLSPYYNHRFYTAVNKGTLYALNNHIPVILYGLNIPFDDGRLKHDILFEDITQYFGMSVNSFLNKYNLGWDSHFNSEGNRIIAESIIQSLVKHNLIRDVSVNGYHNNLSEDKSWNWAQHKKSREKFIQKFIQPYVDFKKFQNIHQLVGGLLPTRVFPIFDGAMLALILKQEGSNSLYILGDNRSENDIEILVQIGIDEYEKEISVPSGTFEEIILIPNTIKEYYHKNIIDIRIECLKETNPVIQLSYIGLQKPSTAPIQPLIMGDVEP